MLVLGSARKILDIVADIPEPDRPLLDKPYSVIVNGIGGTGVVTISAVLGQAAHIEGLGFGSIDMAGLAQKGGAVACHLRFGQTAGDIHAIRVGIAGADLIIGGDLIVTGSHKILETVRFDDTRFVVNAHPVMTGEFTHEPDLRLPQFALRKAIEEAAGSARVDFIDAHEVTEKLFGSNIYANMFLMGFAYQKGLIPLRAGSIEGAIRLNGVAPETNLEAFRFGRLGAHDQTSLDRLVTLDKEVGVSGASDDTFENIMKRNWAYLVDYQDEELANKYRDMMQTVSDAVGKRIVEPDGLMRAIAKSYFKLLAYKDEYEVARLFSNGAFEKEISEHFEGDYRIEYHLAPPVISSEHPDTGLPVKRSFGRWMGRVFGFLAKYKNLRGTKYDVFGYSAERRLERQLIDDFEKLLDRVASGLSPENEVTAFELVELPQMIRGFGHVKLAAVEAVRKKERVLLKRFEEPTSPSEKFEAA